MGSYSMFKEFKEFAFGGNALDLAVGVIIGAAFGAIVNSMVGDIIMPIIGAVTGGLDFSNHFTPLSKAVNCWSAWKIRVWAFLRITWQKSLISSTA